MATVKKIAFRAFPSLFFTCLNGLISDVCSCFIAAGF